MGCVDFCRRVRAGLVLRARAAGFFDAAFNGRLAERNHAVHGVGGRFDDTVFFGDGRGADGGGAGGAVAFVGVCGAGTADE